MNHPCPQCNNDGGFCNFCGNKPPNAITGEILQKAGEFANEEQRKIFYKDQDPYEAQGSNLRVHHPTQPKTQVERWREEIRENREYLIDNEDKISLKEKVEREIKIKQLRTLILTNHEKNKTYLNRHPV